jgi:hypothetical protein
MCYSYRSSRLAFTAARVQCQALGGDLVEYSSLVQQLLVERYMFAVGTSPTAYWMGVARPSASAAWAYTSGAAVSPLASNSPYQHWTAAQPVRNSNNPGDNCVAGLLSSSYDYYLGGTAYEQQTNTSLYNTGSADAVAGWQSATCSTTLAYICQAPAAMFACYPPPNPPGPPPLPPLPPSPPLPPTCESSICCPGAPRQSRTLFSVFG